MSASVHIGQLVTEGKFSLDGGSWDVENNVWIIGDDAEVLVIDPAHDASAVFAAVAGRRVSAILLSHGHDDHIRAVGEFQQLCGAQIFLHSADNMLWEAVYPGAEAPRPLTEGDEFPIGSDQLKLRVLHTPEHSPGSCYFYLPDAKTVFSGDTLFQGGPGATGRSYSDFPTIIESITAKLLTLPGETLVRTGH
ncbi:beta-lactamase domain protein [Renibacterium salmoninarum ATCC 33209]|uniref:Beta-lactamase domain protein n=1 Tax=Renibacterium salmoninarum (strain ATCC 33209 / DSM 20767 / JCM 11484 / NBRC 15589 / NCIMB 2235) TaxID=288705 RepID=A9WT16_RENSM|nr:MBL fold metallo-hydrolase [Renibacterium salmoninarum]ABY23954.1 beta-lactamase domain protein [Renibacterium salmoninarum ATCC 33209]